MNWINCSKSFFAFELVLYPTRLQFSVLPAKVVLFYHPKSLAKKTLLFTFQEYAENLNLNYTRCITPKRVTSLRGPFPRHCARATQLLLNNCRKGGKWSATLSSIFGSGGRSEEFALQTSHFRDKCVSALPMTSGATREGGLRGFSPLLGQVN